MAITRISVADLRTKARGFTSEETARLDTLTDEEIERRALSDPDARPATPDMMRRGRANRQHRLFAESARAGLLGASLSEAEPELDLPVWEVTDRHGRKVYLKAANVRRAAPPSENSRVVVLDAVSPSSTSGADAAAAGEGVSSGLPEKQVT